MKNKRKTNDLLGHKANLVLEVSTKIIQEYIRFFIDNDLIVF